MSWLKEHKIPYDAFVRSESTKAKARLSYDVFIDDSPELMSLVSSSLHKCGILYTQPWNRNAADMQRVFRVEGWEEIPPVLERVSTMKK
jgi:5'(3')-deoxyribonucleotidase